MATQYFSGQGSFFVAERNADGTPKNFVDLCNVSAMEFSIEITKFEHKESKSGVRAIDLTIIQETNGTFTATLENINTFNLALALFGTKSVVAAAAVASEIVPVASQGGFYILDHMNLDDTIAVTAVLDETGNPVAAWVASTAYALGDRVEPTAANGRFYEATVAGTSDACEPTFPTVVGDTVVDSTVTWTDQGLQVLVEGTDFSVNAGHGTLKVNDDVFAGDNSLDVGYTHLGYSRVDALTVTSQVRWLRFEGLNTVDDTPVVIDFYKAELDPVTGFGVINDEIAQMEITGNILFDDTRAVGDQFLRVRQVGDVDNSCVFGGQ